MGASRDGGRIGPRHCECCGTPIPDGGHTDEHAGRTIAACEDCCTCPRCTDGEESSSGSATLIGWTRLAPLFER